MKACTAAVAVLVLAMLMVSAVSVQAAIPEPLAETAQAGPVIAVLRNANVIANGAIDVLGAPVPDTGFREITYEIANFGSGGTLQLTGTPRVQITGAANVQAFIAQQPAAAALVPSAMTPFVVRVEPDSPGVFSVALRIEHNAAAAAPFEFTLEGMASVTPELTVHDPLNRPRIHGDSHHVGYLRSYFAQSIGYTIRNTGSTHLLLGSPCVAVSDMVNCTVTVTQPALLVLPPGAEAGFGLLIEPAPSGPFAYTLTIDSNDPLRPVFTTFAEGWATTIPQSRPMVERPAARDIRHGEVHVAGFALVGVGQPYEFTLRNIGVEPLPVGLVAVSAMQNAVAVGAVQPAVGTLAYGEHTSFTVVITPIAPGPWQVRLHPGNASPMLPDYWVTVRGEAVAAARPGLAVERLPNSPLPNGGRDAVGFLPVGVPSVFVYWIRNVGLAPLSVERPVVVSGTSRAAVSLVALPGPTVAPVDGLTPLVLAVTPNSAQPFSFQVALTSDDPDQPTYTVLVTANTAGTAVVAGPNKYLGGCGGAPAGMDVRTADAVPLLALLALAVGLLAVGRRYGAPVPRGGRLPGPSGP